MVAASCFAFAAARDSRSRLLRAHRRPKRLFWLSFHLRSLQLNKFIPWLLGSDIDRTLQRARALKALRLLRLLLALPREWIAVRVRCHSIEQSNLSLSRTEYSTAAWAVIARLVPAFVAFICTLRLRSWQTNRQQVQQPSLSPGELGGHPLHLLQQTVPMQLSALGLRKWRQHLVATARIAD